MAARSKLVGAVAGVALALTACGQAGSTGADTYPSETVSIMAPADPGGGWDTTARELQQALDTGVVAPNVEVYNVGGAGGTIGLAEFVTSNSADPHELMVTGLVMLGAIQTNRAPVDLTQVTPIASLATEYEAIAVRADSPYQTFDDLVAAFRDNPRSVSWGGGSAGGADHILVGLLAQAAGVDPAQINYIAHAGGGEAMAAILSGGVTAGVSGVSEFTDQVEAGQLRILAVSGEQPVEGVDAPTIRDTGLDVVLTNWRGLVAPPGLSSQQRDEVVGMVQRAHDTPEWQRALADHGWTDFFVTGDEFGQFLTAETDRVRTVLSEIGLTQ
jgi:putative tricarboxylic transport membrane protein